VIYGDNITAHVVEFCKQECLGLVVNLMAPVSSQRFWWQNQVYQSAKFKYNFVHIVTVDIFVILGFFIYLLTGQSCF